MQQQKKIIDLTTRALGRLSKQKLIDKIKQLRKRCESQESKIVKQAEEIAELTAELAKKDKNLQEQAAELDKIKKKEVNSKSNQPSSKQPEFNKDTGGKSSKNGARRRKKGKRGKRKGAGNRAKPTPEVTNYNELLYCPDCQTDLSGVEATEKKPRIVEDIAELPKKTVVSEEIQDRKWCKTCKKIVSSKTEAALPKFDIGLRATCVIAYLWVVTAISLPGIVALLKNFFSLKLSTAGVSKMMINLSKIMQPVYAEILEDVKGGRMIFADETGWRVKGKLWWLWIFANQHSAYYFPSTQRGSAVVEKILGTTFHGVLITDAWHAYMKIICSKQTCMAHIMRKIRKFRDAYPRYYSIMQFYRKLRRLLMDGVRLQENRKKLGDEVFNRRLKRLHDRLDNLLAWKNPNAILKDVIAKVERQREHILTFVEHEGVPHHNNYGEYIIKKGILKRKVSGGSMSEAGVRAYAVIQSIAQTCHLRGIPFLDFMQKSLVCYIRTGQPLRLKDYALEQESSDSSSQEALAA